MARGPKDAQRRVKPTAKVVVAGIGPGDEDELTADGKSKAAVSLGRRGGKARAAKISSERRVEIARNAAIQRWRNKTGS